MTQLHSRRHEVVSGVMPGEDYAECMSESSCVSFTSSVNTVVCCDDFFMEKLSVIRAVNNVAVSGAEPLEVLLSLIMPEEAEESDIRSVISRSDAECGKLGVQISGCDIEISRAVSRPVLTVCGMGKKNIGGIVMNAGSGNDIVMTKWAALSGTAVLADKMRPELLKRFSGSFIDTAVGFDELFSVAPEAAVAAKSGTAAMHDASFGGIFGALWEIAERSGVGLEIDLRTIPIRQETVEICNYLDISPYELMSDGSLLIACDNGYDLVRDLKKSNIEAAVIGKVTEGNDRCVINEDERRFLEPPRTDAVYRYIQ